MDRPVLPATCAISWIANTCEQLYPGYTFFSYSNFKVLKGIVFDANLADKYILDLAKNGTDKSQNLKFDAKIWSKNKAGKIRYHFSSQLEITCKKNNPIQYHSADLSPQNISGFKQDLLYQNGRKSLFHGASFQGVKRVINVSQNKLTTECFLPNLNIIDQGQFPVKTFNPYLVDVQIHALWLWLQYNHREICLPSEIITSQQFATIDFNQTFYVSCEIKTKTKTTVTADIIAHDRDGKIYSRMLGAKGTIISF
jgi:hypothetical protein